MADPVASERAISFGPFRLLPQQRLLLEGDKPVRLGSRAFDILGALVERAGQVVDKEAPIARAWPQTLVEESNLKLQVSALRRALGDGQGGGQGGHRYVVNVPGPGYNFVAPVHLEEPPQVPVPPATAPAGLYSKKRTGSPRPLGRAAVAAAGAFLLIAPGQSVFAHDLNEMPRMHHGTRHERFSFGEPGNPSKVDRIVRITMGEMSFEPSTVAVRVDETKRFVIANKSRIDHDFTIGDAGTQTKHRAEMAEMMQKGEMNHRNDPNEVMVGPGQQRELMWKFTRAGSCEFDCNVPGHFEAGMRGVIEVRGKGSRRADSGVETPPKEHGHRHNGQLGLRGPA
jgi:uncharacterized cupredoxin-like copper-binding protein/DNA-binding winged helix-turn-helix (wHTH) protein